MRLTDKQEKFVQGLLKGMSQRQAYKNAYSTQKMKDKTIDERASVLLKNSKVGARFDELKNKVVKKAEEKAVADAVEVMEYYTKLMRGQKTDEVIMMDNMGNVIREEKRVDHKVSLSAAKELGKRYGIDKPVADKTDKAIKIQIVGNDEDE